MTFTRGFLVPLAIPIHNIIIIRLTDQDWLLPTSHGQYFLMLRLSIRLTDQYLIVVELIAVCKQQEQLHKIIIIQQTYCYPPVIVSISLGLTIM